MQTRILNILFTLCFFTLMNARAGDASDVVKLVFAGDIMLDTAPGQAIAEGRDPFEEFATIFAEADYAVGNLECVVATVGTAVEKPFTFRAHPRVLPVLKKHFDLLSLANNHTGDFGHAAFVQQLKLLKDHKIPFVGGGQDCREARIPHLVEIKGVRIAVLAYNDFKPRTFEAGPDWPGVAWAVDEQVIADVRAARNRHKADIVIPYMHWGWEGEGANDRQRKLARRMIDNGATLVVGAHPHVTQGAEYYNGKLIVYSLGNFLFDGFKTPETNTGWVLRLSVDRVGLVEWDTIAARLDGKGIPHVGRDVESPRGYGVPLQMLQWKFRK